MQSEKQQPYFFNPDMHPVQLEEWLNQQKNHVATYNRLCRERATLIEQLEQVEATLHSLSSSGFKGKLSFPYSPSPLL
ncbi:hypothetical protein PZO64_07150 [Pantoea vagans]|nr:hypothetical protein [Pantoea vagans]MDE8556097.1 hypothetical protein [Pantoea vagans]MDE8576148.1 hypothetical protein [Pantoea vagans]